ncbi:MAG: signal peptide peptidase SppA [Crocinitomicaceae bacterium]|nr:MAG: signal peptide peptidase SppA [Crocinitomicaceae bacterium]
MSEVREKKVTFGRIFWPSLVAVLIVSVISLILFFVFLGGLIGSFAEPTPYAISDKTVLHMTLEGELAENGSTKFNPSTVGIDNKVGLSDLLFGLEKAKTDENVKGVFIEIKDLSCGFATAREIREAINDFEKSGKFAVAYNAGEVITQKEYYVASAANQNFGFPTSTMEFVGLGTELMFFKNTLDMLEVEMQVIRGKNNDFKSAVEPYFRTEMSDSSRLQINRYLKSIWTDIRTDIGKDRKIAIEDLDAMAENMVIHRAADAVKHKLLDAVKYRDEVMDLIAKKAGVKSVDDLNLSSFEKYAKKKFYVSQSGMGFGNANVAVILAEGDVSVDGDGLTSKKICKYLHEARMDKDIKTIVLRINSPGGSALASDEIWREVSLANKKKKVIVSMGDVAASGGYYIAAPADVIFAQPTTITGSIGVFGVIPFTGNMLQNKLGLTFDRASTNKHAVISTNRKLTEEEFTTIQNEVDVIYAQFLNRVSEGRGMTVEAVNQVARGRVWTGADALKVGLVDKLGGINDAIRYAAKKAGVKDVKIKYWPKKKEDALSEIFEQFAESEQNEEMLVSQKGMPESLRFYYEQLKKLEQLKGIQMRMPYEIVLN